MTPRRLQRLTLAGAAGLLMVFLIVAALAPQNALRAWYAATIFWTGIPLGALVTLSMHHLTSGRWGWYLRPLLHAAIATLPFVLLAYLPLLLAMDVLFPWTAPPESLEKVVRHKLAYLNTPFFLLRAGLFALIWLGSAWAIGGFRRDSGGRRYAAAAASLILYALSVTFFGVDWVQSLEPAFYSSTIGYLMATSQFVGVLAFCIAMAALLRPAWSGEPPFHDLGNLLLGAVLLWTYIAFGKYLIIWEGNLPHEIEWYVQRQQGLWLWLTIALMALHFCVPFFLLLFKGIKRSRALLGLLALGLLAAHALEVGWLVLPSFPDRAAWAGLVDVLAMLALGALWLLLFLWRLSRTDWQKEARHG